MHSEVRKKKRQTKEEMGGQHSRVDRHGAERHPESGRETRGLEKGG